MIKPIAVVSADTHLEPYAWARHPTLSGDSYYSFKQIVEFTKEKELPLILAGDIFDKSYPDPYSVAFALDQLKSISNNGVYFIQGQHEFNRHYPWLSISCLAIHLHRSGIKIGGLVFYGLDFMPANKLNDELSNIPKSVDVLIAHQVWEEHMGKKASLESSFRNVPHVKCIITGDYHCHQVLVWKGKDDQDIIVASPGSTCLQSMSEDPEKYFFLIYDDLTFESIKLKTRQLVSTRIGTETGLQEAIDKIIPSLRLQEGVPKGIDKPIWQVKCYDTVRDALQRIESALNGKAHLFFETISTDILSSEIKQNQKILADSGLEGHLDLVCDVNSPIYKTCLRLLRSNNPKEEIQDIVHEFLESDTDPWST